MKAKIRTLSGLTFLGILLITAQATFAQVPVETSTTTTTSTSSAGTVSSGTVTQFSPNAIVVRTTTASDPVSYSYSKTTTYVDENGSPVSVETVRSGQPVTVYYDRNGNQMVATKVVVKKTTHTTTTTP